MQSARFVRAATIVCSVVPALAIAATSQRLTGTRHMGALVRGALAGVERSKILVPIWAQGGTPCLYFPTFDWRGPIVRAIPPPRGVARVELTLVDAYALVARAPGGFMMALDTPEPLGSRTSGAYGPGGRKNRAHRAGRALCDRAADSLRTTRRAPRLRSARGLRRRASRRRRVRSGPRPRMTS
jgi:hypothetical protein